MSHIPTTSARSGKNPEWYASFKQHVTDKHSKSLKLHGKGCDVCLFSLGEGKLQILFEGYLYDQEALAKRLNISLTNKTDAELAGLAYLHFGEDIFEKLRGRYLLAVHDSTKGCLYITHDGMGLHPVYYAQCKDEIIFSSNVFALAYSGKISRAANKLSIALSMFVIYPPKAGETHFAHIRRIRPGHLLSITQDNTLKESCFWEIIPRKHNHHINTADCNEAFEEKFQIAVNRCLTRKPEGIMLSGGLDSISVLSVASHARAQTNEPLLQACIATNPPGYPQTELITQQRVIAHLGLSVNRSHGREWLNGGDMIGKTIDVSAVSPGPIDFWWAGLTHNFHRTVVKQGVSTVLTGSGGDEWMGVHPAYAADLIKSLSAIKLSKFIISKAVTANLGWKSTLKSTLWRYGLRLILNDLWPSGFVNTPTKNASKEILSWMLPDKTLRSQVIDYILQLDILRQERRREFG